MIAGVCFGILKAMINAGLVYQAFNHYKEGRYGWAAVALGVALT